MAAARHWRAWRPMRPGLSNIPRTPAFERRSPSIRRADSRVISRPSAIGATRRFASSSAPTTRKFRRAAAASCSRMPAATSASTSTTVLLTISTTPAASVKASRPTSRQRATSCSGRRRSLEKSWQESNKARRLFAVRSIESALARVTCDQFQGLRNAHLVRLRRCRLSLQHSGLYPVQDRFGNRKRSQINRPAKPGRGAEDLDLAADAPVKPQHGGVEIGKDRFDPRSDGDLAQSGNQDGGSKEPLSLVHDPIVETDARALPDRGSAEVDGVRKRVGKEIGQESWAGRRQKPQASLHFKPFIVGVNQIDRRLVVIPIALLAAGDLNVPSEPVAKDASAQPEHLLQQVRVAMRIMFFNQDDHWKKISREAGSSCREWA